MLLPTRRPGNEPFRKKWEDEEGLVHTGNPDQFRCPPKVRHMAGDDGENAVWGVGSAGPPGAMVLAPAEHL